MLLQLNKWGNSVGLRIPKELREELDLEVGSELNIKIEDKKMILVPARKKKAAKKDSFEKWVDEFTKDVDLDKMIKNHNPKAYKNYNWGLPMGREIPW